MKFLPTSPDSQALTCVTLITLSIFIAGLLDVLDYIIVKGILFLAVGTLFIFAVHYAVRNDIKENRLKDIPQDDSH